MKRLLWRCPLILFTLVLPTASGAEVAAVGAAAATGAPSSGWVDLFDGRTLEGWRAAENASSFKVVEGSIVCDGPRAHLFYSGPLRAADFRNFELSVEVMTQPGANSGVYFHTAFQESDWPAQGFEVQVNNTQARHGNYLELKKTGSLYGIRNVHRQLLPDQVWFNLRIVVRGPTVQVRLNDLLVVDYRQPEAEIRTADGPVRRLGHGTFALQCHDPESRVLYRNLRARVLPDEDSGEPGQAPLVDERYRRYAELAAHNFPLINLHAHLKGGLTLEDVLAESRRTGLNYGIAVNCGVGFAITNDAGACAFVESMQGKPVFVAMQAEGREWTGMFSESARKRFDYVFTDGMTFTDARGKRVRLWIPSEVEVGDKEVFMEYLVDQIVRILDTEPVDLFVNPTFLPEAIAGEYDQLWTGARMQRVIDAAVRHGIAIEINGRYRIPSENFLRRAKAAGARFTFGSNNGGREDLNALDYCLEMQRQLGLTWEDMYTPGVRR